MTTTQQHLLEARQDATRELGARDTWFFQVSMLNNLTAGILQEVGPERASAIHAEALATATRIERATRPSLAS